MEAQFGDETAKRDITKAFQSKLNSEKEISVDSSLIPLIQAEGEVSLNGNDIAQAKGQAEQACGGNSSDTACMEKQQQQIQQQMLEEKKNMTNSTSNIIKGRRLRLVVLEDNKRKVYEIPDGQMFTPDKLGLKFASATASPGQTKAEGRSWTDAFNADNAWSAVKTFIISISSFLLMFLYVVSILTTWQAFRKAGYEPKFAAIPTGVAILFPYSGFFITGGFFLVLRYYMTTKDLGKNTSVSEIMGFDSLKNLGKNMPKK